MSGVIVGGQLINPENIVNKLAQAFGLWANEDLNDGFFEDQFKEDKWEYPGYTRRKSGESAGTVRNIYDLGELYDSGKQTFRITQGANDISASWNWNAKNSSDRAYALYVHEGIGTNLEARPWTDELYYPQKFANSSVRLALKRRIKAALG